MCGIVGFVGNNSAKEVILDGLKKLEYRGYDSAGLALICDKKLVVRKHVGGISNLEKMIEGEELKSNIGIGHTRWATHGVPSDANAHPHVSFDGNVAIVHNGIIENYQEIKARLIKDYSIEFKSETDTEVCAHLIGLFYKDTKDLEEAVYLASKEIKGQYAIVAISEKENDKIVAIRKDCPLICGVGKDANYVASDIPALLSYANDIYPIGNDEMVIVTSKKVTILDENRKEIKHEPLHITWKAEDADKEGFPHYMLKEIFEQPKVIESILERRIDKDKNIVLDDITITKKDLDNINKIYIVACGTAYHAGLVGKTIIEKYAKIPVECDVASEFRYRDPLVDSNTLFIAISQSGETSDTLQALREAKKKGARVLSIVNVTGSSVARESDDVLYTYAGPEIAVASTKAYTTQLVTLYQIAIYFARLKNTITKKQSEKLVEDLFEVPNKIREFLKETNDIQKLAKKLSDREKIFFIGRGLDAAVCYEASLKLKEISYINSFAIQAGELKHGTIALIENDTAVISLATIDSLFDKMMSNISEIKARGAFVISLSKVGNKKIKKFSDSVIFVPKVRDELTPIITIVPLQLFAYYVALEKGVAIDKPRNLAKSVTVE